MAWFDRAVALIGLGVAITALVHQIRNSGREDR